jgi:hypothetical protein
VRQQHVRHVGVVLDQVALGEFQLVPEGHEGLQFPTGRP